MIPQNDTLIDASLALIGRASARRPFVLGITGAQGSGKSTLAEVLADRIAADGRTVAVLSIDDLYLTRADRQTLARTVHPLLATRGPPGTHDVAMGLAVFAALDRGEAVALPRFDKSIDDRAPMAEWPVVGPDVDVLLFEGWCVGARPEPDAALDQPINTLEWDEDGEGVWRRFANDALAGDYQRLFGRIDAQILLAAPGFDVVRRWRTQQEEALRARVGDQGTGLMDEAAVAHFIQHYERLTRWLLTEMPARADLVAELAEDRDVRRMATR